MNIRTCSLSVMDTLADPDITFNEAGVCNYYFDYVEKTRNRLHGDDPAKLNSLVERMKKDGRGKEYDCVIGVSGGVDSTYLAYRVKELGLRPLAIHFDNGWNSELAVKNIENILKKLNIDLFTHVIDWEEFKSLQIAFLKASTPDGEIPTDHAITALLFRIASAKKIKYILSGANLATEAVLPRTWAYGHIDWKYIRNTNDRFGSRKLSQYPYMTVLRYLFYTLVRRIKVVSFLNYMHYNKTEAMDTLKKELDWKYYGGKHYESIYTRFFQGYILPVKFGIDKRKAHLSSLIFSNQLSRQEALDELAQPIYPEGLREEDKNYVLKKLEMTEEDFNKILHQPPKTFRDYPNQSMLFEIFRAALNKLRKKGLMYS